MKFKTLMKL